MNDFKTFIDVNDLDKINEFYRAGFYACDCMYIMEREQEPLSFFNDIENPFVSKLDKSELSLYIKANGKGFSTPDPIEKIESDLSKPNSAIYVYKVKGEIVSSVTVWDEGEDAVATENIFTVPKFRNRGYAQTTLQIALLDACKRGRLKARLTVYAGSLPAINMYYRFGYRITRILQEFIHE